MLLKDSVKKYREPFLVSKARFEVEGNWRLVR
jgi:hypothetical protein